MRVLALGGAGDMGRTAVTTLVNSPSIGSITVADYNIALAEKFVALSESDKLSAVKIDATDKSALLDLMAGHDIVISTIGPYYKFGPLITQACIEAKKSCVDICDDWKPMMDILEMDEAAKKSDITIIPGIGASPGVSNLLAAYAAADFDEVDEIVTAWGAAKYVSGPAQPHHVSKRALGVSDDQNAAVMHLLHESTGTIPTYRNGELMHIDALTEAAPLRFPDFKEMPAYHIGHPEPLTIPRTIKANSVSNVMFYGKPFMELLTKIAGQIKKGELSIEKAAFKFNAEALALAAVPEVVEFPAPICVIVTGMKDGVKIKSALALTHVPYGHMAGSTGVPLAIAGMMLATGRIGKKGVLTPEAAIDPALFLERYAPYCGEGLEEKDVFLKKKEEL